MCNRRIVCLKQWRPKPLYWHYDNLCTLMILKAYLDDFVTLGPHVSRCRECPVAVQTQNNHLHVVRHAGLGRHLLWLYHMGVRLLATKAQTEAR